jgi:hypothetical protein
LFPVSGTELNSGRCLILHHLQDSTLRHASSPDRGKQRSVFYLHTLLPCYYTACLYCTVTFYANLK